MDNINFGITEETRSEGTLLFPAPVKLDNNTAQFPKGYKFPVGTLVNVIADAKKETKNGEKSILQFIFIGAKKEQHTHIEWEVEDGDDKAQKKLEGMQSRIKHILEQVGLSFPKEGIGSKATNFTELFEATANYFNSQVIEKEGEKPVKKYSKYKVYLKLTYYKTNLNFPMFPNFIQLAQDKDGKAVPCELAIDMGRDNLEPNRTNGGLGLDKGTNVGGDLTDLPNFD